MDPSAIIGLMAAGYLVLGAVLWRMPVRCGHDCPACRQEAYERARRRDEALAKADHRWHADVVEGCPYCTPR